MRVRIKKWGDGASVCIPAVVMAAAAISVDQTVDIRGESGRIVIERIRSPIGTLDDLLARMSPETFPDNEGFGPGVGKEI